MVRLRLRATALAMGAVCLLGCLGDSGDAARTAAASAAARCEQLAEHTIALPLGDALADSPDREAHRAALRASFDDRWRAECASQPVAQLDCALTAQDGAALAQCAHEVTP